MTSLLEPTLKRIQSHRLPELDLGPEAVHPAYDGLSILNVPASLSRWLGAPDLPHPRLDLEGLDELAQGVRQIVVLLADAVGLHSFEQWLQGPAVRLAPLLDEGFLCALTSICPSTTCAAMTTLWTGRSPAEHGILGYELLLREYGAVVNMITQELMTLGVPLVGSGFDPEGFLPVPTLGPHLASAGVETHAFMHFSIARSGLSRMHLPQVKVHTFGGVHELWVDVRQLAETPTESRRLIWAYYGGVDNLAHRFGPEDERPAAEFAGLVQAMMSHFVERLSPEARAGTLLVLLADHGQIATPKNPHFDLRNHPELARRLHLSPTGEHRLSFLYPRPGQLEAVEEYFDRAWPNSFLIFPSAHALKSGLFGPGAPASTARDRIGDRIALSQGNAYLWWADHEDPLRGRHGGLTAREMLVPFLAVRLDA